MTAHLYRLLKRFKDIADGNAFLIFLFFVVVTFKLVVSQVSGIWMDETYIFNVSRQFSLLDLILIRHWDASHPPLFYILNKGLISITQNIKLLRLVSIAVSACGLWILLAWLKRESNSFKQLNLFAVVLIGLSFSLVPLHLLNQSYAYIFTMSALMVYYTFEYVYYKEHLSKKHYIFLSSLYFLSFLMDYSAIWTLLSLALFFSIEALSKKISTDKVIFLRKVYSLSAILFLLWSPVFFKSLGQAFMLESNLGDLGYNSSNPWLNPIKYWSSYMTGFFHPALSARLGVKYSVMPYILYFLSFVGILYIVKMHRRVGLFLIISFVLPVVIAHSYSVLSGNTIFSARNLWQAILSVVIGYAGFSLLLYRAKYLKPLALIFTLVLVGTYIEIFPGLGYRVAWGTDNGEGAKLIINDIESLGLTGDKKPNILLYSNYHPHSLETLEYYLEKHGYNAVIKSIDTKTKKIIIPMDEWSKNIKDRELRKSVIYLLNTHFHISPDEKHSFDRELFMWGMSMGCNLTDLSETKTLKTAIRCLHDNFELLPQNAARNIAEEKPLR